MKYDQKEVFLRELTEMYYSNDYDSTEAINYFNTQNSVERKEIVHTFFRIYDSNLRGIRTQSCYDFYEKICPAALKKILISDTMYSTYISEYINNEHFIKFNNLGENFFSNVIMTNKIDFLKLFSISPSEKLLLNHLVLNFEFNEEEKNEIKKIIDSKLEIKELEYKKIIMNKIGIYNTYLLFEFDESTTTEEFEFFFENINKFNDEQLLQIVFNNFFYNVITSLRINEGESFRLKEYLHLYNLKPEIFTIINDIFKNKKHHDLLYIENIMKYFPELDHIMDIIYEKINISLMLKNF